MPNDADFKKRIESEAKATMPIRNDDLVCKDCIYKYDDSERPGNTSKCEVYDDKPNDILGGGNCKYKEVE